MNETRYEVWWSGKKEWAQMCVVSHDYKAADGFEWIIVGSGMTGAEVPDFWLHPVEPEIAPGALVYAWDGKRPADPPIGKYRGFDGKKHMVQVTHCDRTSGIFDYYHIEPIAQQPEIDWSKIASFYGCLVRFDSGAIIAGYNPKGWQVGQEGTIGTVTEIIPRPKS